MCLRQQRRDRPLPLRSRLTPVQASWSSSACPPALPVAARPQRCRGFSGTPAAVLGLSPGHLDGLLAADALDELAVLCACWWARRELRPCGVLFANGGRTLGLGLISPSRPAPLRRLPGHGRTPVRWNRSASVSARPLRGGRALAEASGGGALTLCFVLATTQDGDLPLQRPEDLPGQGHQAGSH